jgi:hypothetical protein
LGWLNSGRFIRALAPIAGLALVAVVLYNATSVDRVPPSYHIKLSAPLQGSGLALTLTSIDVVFSEQVKRETAEAAFSISPDVAVSLHWQGLTLIVTPSAKLPLSTAFTVNMAAGVQDSAGNSQSKGQEITFTTVGRPIVTAVLPAASAVSVPVDSTIQITFDRLMDLQKALEGLTISPPTPYTATWKGASLSIVPDDPLVFGTTYSIMLGDPAIDTDGTPISPFTSTFTTVGVGLRATALIPAANVAGVSVQSPVAVVFDGPVDPSSIADAIHLTPPVSGSIQVVKLPDDRQATASASPSATQPAASPNDSGKNVLVFTPDGRLAPHTTYTVSMSPNVRRTDGGAAAGQTWSFTTGEPVASAQNQIVYLSDRGGVANVWLMNPDGSNQREITAELVPVSGFDVSGDGNTIAFGAGGVVKWMGISGDNVHLLTASGSFDYAPEFTPDGTALIVGRRDATGADLGYWRIPIVSGADPTQVVPDGAPALGSVTLQGDELTGLPGEPSWAPRAAFSADGKSMLVVRGLDDEAELVDVTGANPPVALHLTGNSRPIWDPQDGAFHVVANSGGPDWSSWRVSTDGSVVRDGAAAGDLSVAYNGPVAAVLQTPDGSFHVAISLSGSSAGPVPLTNDRTWSDGSPSFSPDGSLVVFGRYATQSPKVSGGIWVIGPDGNGLTKLAADGAYPRWLP